MKRHSNLETKLKKIAIRSIREPNFKFDRLICLFSKENLIECFHKLDEGKAVGIDCISKADYEVNLDSNIARLVTRMKGLKYRPAPVREVQIPKADGGVRPLGISNLEDKIVQSLFAMILEAVFEPHFLEHSYGFRPNRNCHKAIKKVNDFLFKHNKSTIIDADVQNYFGSLDPQFLIEFVGTRIVDKMFLRYLARLLKSRVLTTSGFQRSDEGSPQGAICSPVLSNIYGHFVLDQWFSQEIATRFSGVELVRYADDFIICCPDHKIAERILAVLHKRFNRFKLELHPEKTKLVCMNRKSFSKGIKQPTFNFLGFTFYIGKSKRGYAIPRLKSERKRFSRKLSEIGIWLKRVRNMKSTQVWFRLNMILKGYMAYYSISNNQLSVSRFFFSAENLFFKWMNRRSQRKSFNWENFLKFKKLFPQPTLKVYFRLFKAC